MNTRDEIKEAVRIKYDSIARTDRRGEADCSSPEVTCVGDSYAQVHGYVAEADLGRCELPENIKSCWVFVLKKGVPSGCHYHPNSIQHMVMIEGQGESNVAGVRKRMVRFGSANHSPDEIWYVIPEGVPHEFFPEASDMVVISFHTCAAEELEEVSCQTGGSRLYEG